MISFIQKKSQQVFISKKNLDHQDPNGAQSLVDFPRNFELINKLYDQGFRSYTNLVFPKVQDPKSP